MTAHFQLHCAVDAAKYADELLQSTAWPDGLREPVERRDLRFGLRLHGLVERKDVEHRQQIYSVL